MQTQCAVKRTVVVITTLEDLGKLLDLMRDRGVVHVRLGDVEITLNPEPPTAPLAVEDEMKVDNWRGLGYEEQKALGLVR